MDRGSFLKSLVAMGLMPRLEAERLLVEPEPVEPSPGGTGLQVNGFYVRFDDVLLEPRNLSAHSDPIEVTSMGDYERTYPRGIERVSVDIVRGGKRLLPAAESGQPGILEFGFDDVSYSGRAVITLLLDNQVEFTILGALSRHG